MKKILLIFLFGVLAGSFFPSINTYEAPETKESIGDLTPVATLPDGALYEGDMEDGVFHGQGKMVWPDGSQYQGHFKDGYFHGFGRLEMSNGDVYEGDFSEADISGQGVYSFADGSRYEGELKNGLFEGIGNYRYDGNSYIGDFKNDVYHGAGKLREANGACYTGEFVNGDFHGQGVYCDNEGNKYSGEFIAGVFSGQGSYTDEQDNRYEGGFEDWSFQGQGTYSTAEGDEYIGSFIEGSLTGKGEYTGNDGEHYKGEFDYWGYEGKGRLKTAAGDVYEGQFANGQYDGAGVMTYAKALDGVRQVSGEWRYGELIKSDDGRTIHDPEVLAETVLYNQNALLETSWRKLRDNDSDNIDLYFLGIAGDGKQAVFRREVQFVSEFFEQQFDTQGQSMTLINDRSTINETPLATVTSIKQSLQKIAARMDAENDILFIYMSSHGSSDFEFSLAQSGVSLGDLSAQTLGELLSEVPVRWKVVVVSACYSGGFIPELADDNTLVITAAADDRSSFGCSDRAEFSYFGEAFFKQALPISDSFVSAFEKAAGMITIREFFKGYKGSKPQLQMGVGIKQQLQRWRQQMDKQPEKLLVDTVAELSKG